MSHVHRTSRQDVDKHVLTGLDAVEKKLGQSTGHAIDTNKMRSTNEKIVSSSDVEREPSGMLL